MAEITNRDAIQGQLERIVQSSGFRRCAQLTRFLRFAVEQTISGQNGSAKECLIGMEIFRRPADYDPSCDPIVRVEARRLRRKLTEYYEREGVRDPIEIRLPKGGYLPVFEERESVESGAPAEPNAMHSLAVLPFVDRSLARDLDGLVDGLTVRLITKLALCDRFRVVSSTSIFRFKKNEQDARRIAEELNAELILEGSLRRGGKRYRCDTQLISSTDGLHVWAGSFESGHRNPFAVEDEFADLIARGVRAATMAE